MDDVLTLAYPLLAGSLARWQQLAGSVTPELLGRRPAPEAWSALECLQHLLDVEQNVFPVRLRALLAGEDFPNYDPETEGSGLKPEQAPAALAAEFGEWRSNTLSLLATVTPDDLARTARHAALGVVTLNQFLNEWVAHDLMHLMQAEQAVMQPFAAASGPWRGFFADYDLGKKDVERGA
jgi:hypothetical protein